MNSYSFCCFVFFFSKIPGEHIFVLVYFVDNVLCMVPLDKKKPGKKMFELESLSIKEKKNKVSTLLDKVVKRFKSCVLKHVLLNVPW